MSSFFIFAEYSLYIDSISAEWDSSASGNNVVWEAVHGFQMIEQQKIRKEFPETWLWDAFPDAGYECIIFKGLLIISCVNVHSRKWCEVKNIV